MFLCLLEIRNAHFIIKNNKIYLHDIILTTFKHIILLF